MKLLSMNGRVAASATAGLLLLTPLLTGCQPGTSAGAKDDPAARAKFLGSGPSPEEKAKMAELQAKAMQSGPGGASGPSAAQAEAIKRGRQGK